MMMVMEEGGMKAAVVTDGGLEVREVPAPRPKANEILVRVRAASLNRADLAVAAGHRHGAVGGPGAIPGLEWAGEIAEVGAEVQGLRPGDRVMCSGSSGYAEYAVTDYGRAAPIPAKNSTRMRSPIDFLNFDRPCWNMSGPTSCWSGASVTRIRPGPTQGTRSSAASSRRRSAVVHFPVCFSPGSQRSVVAVWS